MNEFQHVGFHKEVVEFAAVAKSFCDLVERVEEEEKRPILAKLQKFLPLIYLKGSLLPVCESDEMGAIEEAVREEDYATLHDATRRLMAGDDEYLEVFDEEMRYSEAPVVASISENVCDIYQDLKNFISSYQYGIPEVMQEALWQLNANFERYWGKSCASVLRAVHAAMSRAADDENE
jgi:hypothetical protein